jgi:Fe2+ or Zn2+ uptake regulation protein
MSRRDSLGHAGCTRIGETTRSTTTQPRDYEEAPEAEEGQSGGVKSAQVASPERIMAIFEAAGMRNTKQRRIIAERLATLGANGTDFVTQDLWKDLQIDDPGIGRATVFRAVELLHREGVVDRLARADGTHRYRLCRVEHHHHVTCVACQRVVEVETCLPPELLSTVASATNFTIEGHALELFGRCPECRRGAVNGTSSQVG